MSDMQIRELFGVPLYKKKYDAHSLDKPLIMDYLQNEEVYSKNSMSRNLSFTSPNLHKELIFQPFVDFVKSSLTEAFVDLGFVPSFELTGLWATRHIEGGAHHRHTHGNSFLAGVYYLDGPENSSGTNFYSPHHYNTLLIPAYLPNRNKDRGFKNRVSIPWEEGNLIIFPTWLMHDTFANNTGKPRYILSFNCMPVGKTTQDAFDRYNFQSIEDAELVSHNEDLVR